MTPRATVTAAVALLGAVVFLYGVRIDGESVRWVGVGLVGVAFLLRFVDRTRRR